MRSTIRYNYNVEQEFARIFLIRRSFNKKCSLSARSNPSIDAVIHKRQHDYVLPFVNGGCGGIRTPVGVNPNGFQDRLVVTASIRIQV